MYSGLSIESTARKSTGFGCRTGKDDPALAEVADWKDQTLESRDG